MTHAVAATALLYAARALRGVRNWVRIPELATLADPPSLSIVVPARNEERNIEACVRSLLEQRGLDIEVIVVDDRSTDGTRGILAQLEREFPALIVVDGEPLPPDWVGKPWACRQGARRARGAWLLFTDADSRHSPQAALSALGFARSAGADAISLMTGQDLGTFAERAILPAILGLVVFACGPVDKLNDPQQPGYALANGQYILVSRRAYDALGGHDALHNAIVEDIEFARRLKRDGRFRLILAEATQLVRVRMYRSFGEIWDGFTKNCYLAARGNVAALAGGATLCAALSIAPPLLALENVRRRRWFAAGEAAGATAVVIAVAWYGAALVSLPRRYAFAAPLGIAVFGAIAINSTRRGLGGHGFEWRGRHYRSDGTLEPNMRA